MWKNLICKFGEGRKKKNVYTVCIYFSYKKELCNRYKVLMMNIVLNLRDLLISVLKVFSKGEN